MVMRRVERYNFEITAVDVDPDNGMMLIGASTQETVNPNVVHVMLKNPTASPSNF